VLGAGGHAKVITEALILSGREIIGLVSPDHEVGSCILGFSVLGDDTKIFEYPIDEVELVNGVGSLPYNTLRWNLSTDMRGRGYRFATIIHPSAIVSPDVKIDSGAQIMAGVVIQTGCMIGRDVIINTGALIDHDSVIEESCHLAPGTVCSGGVFIEKNTHIGTGSTIIQNVNIGQNSVVAAGSIVYKNLPSNTHLVQMRKERVKES